MILASFTSKNTESDLAPGQDSTMAVVCANLHSHSLMLMPIPGNNLKQPFFQLVINTVEFTAQSSIASPPSQCFDAVFARCCSARSWWPGHEAACSLAATVLACSLGLQ